MNEVIVARLLIYSVLGALIGTGYFSALRWNVDLYVRGGLAWKAAVIHLVRILLIAAAFTLCARQGAAALIASFVGFQLARAMMVNKDRVAMAGSV
ncbi:MAG TPA: ATP synthase subunit I [Candidatus Binataceae bacterium]|nr:ATP synthase subunit I [Candidatus Binataceae bacterium]